MLTIENVQRTARFIHLAMLASIVALYFVLEYVIKPVAKSDNRNVNIVLIVLCIVILNSLVYFRQRFIGTSVESLRSDPSDQEALKKWQAGQLVTFASCEAVALIGVNARILGAPKGIGIALFAVSAYTMIAYRPRPILQQ